MFLGIIYPLYLTVCLTLLLQTCAAISIPPMALGLFAATVMIMCIQGVLTYQNVICRNVISQNGTYLCGLDRTRILPLILLSSLTAGVWLQGTTSLTSLVGMYTVVLLYFPCESETGEGESFPQVGTNNFTLTGPLLEHLRTELFTRSRHPAVALHAALVLGVSEWIEDAVGRAREAGQHRCCQQEMDKILAGPKYLIQRLVPILHRCGVQPTPEILATVLPTLEGPVLGKVMTTNYGTDLTAELCSKRPEVAECICCWCEDKDYLVSLYTGLQHPELARRTLSEEPDPEVRKTWIQNAQKVATKMGNADMVGELEKSLDLSVPSEQTDIETGTVSDSSSSVTAEIEKRSWWLF